MSTDSSSKILKLNESSVASNSSTSSTSSPSVSDSSSSSSTTSSLRSALWSFVIIIPVLAAILAFYGFRGQDVLLGIDLGTTYSAIAYSDGITLGNIPDIDTLQRNIINEPDKDNNNYTPSYTTPSVIAIAGGEYLVGRKGIQYAKQNPEASIIDSKRIIGRLPNDPIVELEAVRHEGRLIIDPRSPKTLLLPAKSSSISIFTTIYNYYSQYVLKKSREPVVLYDGPTLVFAIPLYNQTQEEIIQLSTHTCLEKDAYYNIDNYDITTVSNDFQLLMKRYNTKQYLLLTPTAIGCIIVSHLYKSAIHHFPYVTLGKATVCIPAEFDSQQRYATVQAFTRAGLRVQRIMHEPTAAAMAYGLATTPNIHYVLVFDMGGGTLDVSILFLSEGSFTVIGSAGDNKLGGEDFDDCLSNYLIQQYQENHKIHHQEGIHTEDNQNHNYYSHTLCHPEILSIEAERVKIILSQTMNTTWSCPLASNTHHQSSSSTVTTQNISGTITRKEFESACQDLFDRILVPVEHALEAANVQKHEINEIVLVGGSSRLPGVRQRLAKYFNKEQLMYTVDPDLAVALGAAMNKA